MGTRTLDARVWAAHGDAWQAEGLLRASLGGGAVELPGIRLMASGLPRPQWNGGDVSNPALVDWSDVQSWYAARAHGAGVPWGVCVPAGLPLGRGRLKFRKRCMGLQPSAYRARRARPGVVIRRATAQDLMTLAAIDSAAFGDLPDAVSPWLAPHVGAPGFTVAMAYLDGDAVAIGRAILTDAWAGPSVGIFGVAVLQSARRRGIASGLTAWLIERALAAGARLAHLNPDSDAAQRLYSRLGFVETAALDIYSGL